MNFDDFRFHDKKPTFKQEVLTNKPTVTIAELYPYENLTGDEAAKVMQVPAGFQVQLAAQEPDVTQPIAMAIDDRGRIWIAEAHSYPEREQEGNGKDRIVILEDTDLNGTLDKRTVFIEGLNLVSGLEVGFGGVWVGAAPYFLFIPDRNGNDIPDGQEMANVNGITPTSNAPLQFPKDVPFGATVLLDGWAWQDTHETLNAFIWGPDGWLYGCHGVFTHSRVGKPGTPDDQRVPINAGIWRYHPVRHEFEVFAHGTSNPWGVDFNEVGEAFCTACVIPHLYHIIPGGRYQRQAGQHFNQFTYDDIKTIARHRHFVGNQWNNNDRRASDDLGGGHAHAGAMIYRGGAWPKEYDGKLFMHNIHGNRVNVDMLIDEGSGYAGDRNPDFLHTGDKWSQMINLKYGPDGQVWMIDWYDQNQCHRREEGLHDRTNGRVFRVTYGDVKPSQVNLAEATLGELINHALYTDNEWYAQHARRLIQERSLQETIDWTAITETRNVQEDNPVQMLRLLWLFHITGTLEQSKPQDIDRVLANASPHVRGWCLRLLAESGKFDGLLERLQRLAINDPSPIVRRSIASAVQTLPLSDRWSILEGLV
ncbi:MAG: hypothetical protein KDA80_05565, partial [Planctomycetaceae bacterium]|nr:hypothetical protein [Planctomycetaceae bacterium]